MRKVTRFARGRRDPPRRAVRGTQRIRRGPQGVSEGSGDQSHQLPGAYRIAEVHFLQNNYQQAANSFREALAGDLDPKWSEVWSHINLGKIFDISGQRERAVSEYNLAIRTKDDTQGAQEGSR